MRVVAGWNRFLHHFGLLTCLCVDLFVTFGLNSRPTSAVCTMMVATSKSETM